MTALGWLFIFISWTLILGLVVFCFTKIFRKKKID